MAHRPFELISTSPEETQSLGREIGRLIEPGDVILLTGDLGTGKTCLVQGMAWGIGYPGYAASPSFVLMREYRGRLTLYHADLYRIENAAEAADLNFEECLIGGGALAVEWAEKVPAAFPPEHLRIMLSHLDPSRRRIRFEPHGPRYRELIGRLRKAFGSLENKEWNSR